MSTWSSRLTNGLLNTALLVVGLGVGVLLYALVTRTTAPDADPTRESESTPLVGKIIQVEVRNGCGIDHLAAQTTQFLRDQGFDVVDVGNYKTFDQPKSLVIDRVGDPESARKVARALGLPESRVRKDVRRDLYLDATIVIGEDYQQMRPFRSQ
jgi:hypothetical protein